MAAPYYLAIHGRLVVIGKEPDGNAVRFIADHPDAYAQLKHAHRIHPSADGSVRLRLEGVDAPELHDGAAAQPLGREARDQLLAWIGFTELEYAHPPPPGLPPPASRRSRRSSSVRPPSSTAARSPTWSPPSARRSTSRQTGSGAGRPGGPGPHLQYPAGAGGVAYPTVHASTPVAHRGYLRDLAAETRKTDAGVWADDTTAEFALEDQASIGRRGS